MKGKGRKAKEREKVSAVRTEAVEHAGGVDGWVTPLLSAMTCKI